MDQLQPTHRIQLLPNRLEKGDDRKLMREVGREIAKVVLESDKLSPEERTQVVAAKAMHLT